MKQQASSVPFGVFRGQNFMTPNVRGFYKLRTAFGWAELSEGRGMRDQPIFGVTVRDSRGEDKEHKSQMFEVLKEALDYIESLS